MASIGNLSATITANGQQFINEFKRADNQARRTSASIATSASKMSGAFARGGLKALGLAEIASSVRNEVRYILTEFDKIKGISPETKDSLHAFNSSISDLRENVRGLAAEALAGFANFGSNIGYTIGELVYGKEAADAARSQGETDARQARELEAAKKTAEEVKKLTEEMREAEKAAGAAMAGITGAMLEPAEQADALNAKLGRTMMMLSSADDSTPDGIRERIKLFGDLTNTASSLVRVNNTIAEQMREQQRLAREIGGELAGSFENAIFSGGKLREMLNGIISDMLRLLFREAVTKPLAGAIAGGIGSFFGGGRAAGGPVSSGSAYLVGERGPEIFSPNSSGRIIPNHKLSGGGRGNHYTIDARGASTDAVKELRMLMMQLNASVEPRAVNAVRTANKNRK